MILPKDGGNGYDDGQYVQHDECCSLLGHCDEHSKLHRRRGAPAVCRFVWCRGWVPRSDLEIWSLANLFQRLWYWKTAPCSFIFRIASGVLKPTLGDVSLLLSSWVFSVQVQGNSSAYWIPSSWKVLDVLLPCTPPPKTNMEPKKVLVCSCWSSSKGVVVGLVACLFSGGVILLSLVIPAIWFKFAFEGDSCTSRCWEG